MSNDEGRSTIFLSYAHTDKARAQRLASALEHSGYTVWWDAMIEGGSRFARSIDDALAKADAVVVLWSKNSIESDWVRDEKLESALPNAPKITFGEVVARDVVGQTHGLVTA